MSQGKRRKYDREFKVEAVKLVTEGGRTVAEAARNLGIPENLLYKWKEKRRHGTCLSWQRTIKASRRRTAADETRTCGCDTGARHIKKSFGHFLEGAHMKYQFIEKHRSAFAVEKMCRVLKVTTSGYYRQKKRGISKQALSNEQLDRDIRAAHKKSRGNYGSPRITKELKEQGIGCSENRVARRMQKNGIAAKTKRRFKVTTQSQHKHPVAENVLQQNFGTTAQNQVWVSDITYVWTREGWLYLAIVLDLFSRQIVGWAMSHCLGQDIVLQALRQALLRRGPVSGLIFHSDQGVQYACRAFRELLTQHRIVQSMSGKGNCYDNAVAESFFHTLKTELVYFEDYQTREESRSSIFEYIEVFYNRERRHSALNYMSPVNFEQFPKAA